MCTKLAVGTLKLPKIEQENFDEISIAKILSVVHTKVTKIY